MDLPSLYRYALILMFLLAAVTFPVLFFVTAPYGRHRRAGWGPKIDDTLGWVIMESPVVLLFGLVYFLGPHSMELVPMVLCGLWLAHYIQRTFVFPFLQRGKNRWVPLGTVGLALVFNCLNGPLNAYALSHVAHYDRSWVSDPRFVAGVVLFLVGYSVNRHSDAVLRALRKPGEDGYKVPQAGLHRLVASPNYLGEIIEWGGFALAAWNPAALAFFVFSIANLVPRARAHLHWYRDKFPDYPRSRRALVPFVW